MRNLMIGNLKLITEYYPAGVLIEKEKAVTLVML